MIYTEVEKKELDEVQRVFAEHLRQCPDYELLWSDKHKDFYLLLYNQGLSNMILETLRVSVKLEEANNNLERYAKSMIAGMIWGWIDEWMRQGMPETPEEIVLLTAQLNKEQPKQ